jgi:hypothetical protein
MLALSAAGCLGTHDRAGLSVTDTRDAKRTGRPVFGAPIELAPGGVVIVPFAIESDEDGSYGSSFSKSGSTVGSSVSAGGIRSGSINDDDLRWNNVVFLDNPHRLLLDIPAVITRFHSRSQDGPVRGDYILYAVATRDTNDDGLINREDAVVLSRADFAGRHPTPITSAADHVVDIDWFDGWTYLRVRKESDGDKRFTARDRVELYRVRLDPQQPQYTPELVLDETLRKKAFDIALRAAR